MIGGEGYIYYIDENYLNQVQPVGVNHADKMLMKDEDSPIE